MNETSLTNPLAIKIASEEMEKYRGSCGQYTAEIPVLGYGQRTVTKKYKCFGLTAAVRIAAIEIFGSDGCIGHYTCTPEILYNSNTVEIYRTPKPQTWEEWGKRELIGRINISMSMG